MPVIVKIPTPLRKFSADKDSVVVEAATVGAALDAVELKAPGLRAKIVGDDGKVRKFINIYAGEDDIRFLDGLGTAVRDGTEISIIPAIAGGL